jgi:hypothetical protein
MGKQVGKERQCKLKLLNVLLRLEEVQDAINIMVLNQGMTQIKSSDIKSKA